MCFDDQEVIEELREEIAELEAKLKAAEVERDAALFQLRVQNGVIDRISDHPNTMFD